ncbi:MAG: nitrate reductase associated protein, partial [Halothece sp. Uz-M2-17]|nr:nitrate reductase associated protein [Halothece sp. Uz-M2-17]
EFNLKINREQWQKLTPLQRFALIKLSRPSHENKNFYPALKEFAILE